MAISSTKGLGTVQGSFYDPNRDMYFATPALSPQEQYERETYFRRMQEEEHRRMQQYANYNAGQQPAMLGQGIAITAPKPDPKDPLSFLSKADNKLLLTGATS